MKEVREASTLSGKGQNGGPAALGPLLTARETAKFLQNPLLPLLLHLLLSGTSFAKVPTMHIVQMLMGKLTLSFYARNLKTLPGVKLPWKLVLLSKPLIGDWADKTK